MAALTVAYLVVVTLPVAILRGMRKLAFSRGADARSTEAMNPMDEELRGYLVALEGRLMTRINHSEDRILNRLAMMDSDGQTTKGFLLSDAVIAGRRWLDLEARVTKLEDGR